MIYFPKDDKMVKDYIEKFEKDLIEDLYRVCSFYHQEEIKVLSLTYDLMTEIKEMTIKDFSKVHGMMCQMESCVREVMDLIFFVQLNTQALKHLLKKFDEIFEAFQDPIFKQFFQNNYKNQDSPLRVLLEHQGIVRCYFQ